MTTLTLFGFSWRFFCLFSFLLFVLGTASRWERKLVSLLFHISDYVLGQLSA